MPKKVLISIIGPTAIGKTKLAIEIAQYYKTDIISADSRQFYKEMKIGTAVPTNEELDSAPHHFIQHKSILEPYTVGDFEKEAISLLDNLFKKKDIVVLVGGSGLYVDAITKGFDEFPDINPEIRIELNKLLEEKGIEVLQKKLKKLDEKYYTEVDIENPQRLVRALEVSIGSGKPYSSYLKKKNIKRPFKTFTIGINAEREIIYERINKRVDVMMQEGLLEEAKSLVENKELNALQTVGYKELFKYFDGEWTLEHAISEIKKNTRRFAKRQMTWFRKNKATIWVPYNYKIQNAIQAIEDQLNE
ncbi:tRNA dimethylallyltransferase [Saonia flava]|uniref:tRNA dimethylallyltransferase n=1 Tax=Saonia flava TaxID=523696 RepID=A0A846QKU5_9FLAO|nr:tRNA (adenosine(37)-N6)-dimethylallyltransferase MiaA [Saonia flava]NJB69566.1 tRNA dimethylallyltransferase [Saonia flava]